MLVALWAGDSTDEDGVALLRLLAFGSVKKSDGNLVLEGIRTKDFLESRFLRLSSRRRILLYFLSSIMEIISFRYPSNMEYGTNNVRL